MLSYRGDTHRRHLRSEATRTEGARGKTYGTGDTPSHNQWRAPLPRGQRATLHSLRMLTRLSLLGYIFLYANRTSAPLCGEYATSPHAIGPRPWNMPPPLTR
eukprot:693948-Pyramimonas_sp.AAC.1